LGSFLDARHRGGRWLVRMEDLDTPRVVAGSDSDILRCLEALGLWWDGQVEYQSRRRPLYEHALESLAARGLTYACSCSRGPRSDPQERAYPGTCRGGPTRRGPTALRFRIDDDATLRFEDRIQGSCEYPLAELGDVVVRRRDGVPAYQLAVVVDDAAQSVTSVVRGADLLASTAWQMALRAGLRLSAVEYAHLPLVVEADGSKLAKSRRSVPVDSSTGATWLTRALELLRQDPPADLTREPPARLLAWAVDHWSIERLRGIRTVRARPS
jgi:glutamyl-Q tRNA(Asp) synthetase